MTNPDNSQSVGRTAPTPKRCAIYARYSSEMQRESSIEDQIYKCREYAAKQGMVVLEEYVFSDQAVSGTSLGGRDGISRIMAAAKRRPRPFDFLLIDSTSRLARNLIQALTIMKTLEFLGIHLVSVSQSLNSADKCGNQLFTLCGMMDEQFIQSHADNVRRGQEGCVRKGHIAGGRCYGYRNVPIEDPSQKGDYGRPAVIGVYREVEPTEADVVRRIFEMYASGLSLDKIARKLRGEQVPAPCPPRKTSIRAWSPEGISAILRNEKYIGKHIWKRTTSVRDPDGRVATRPVPEEEWVRHEVPTWQIVSDELWNRVREELERKKHYGIPKHGGLGRTERSQSYLFSGLLVCGLCVQEGRGERSIVIVDGSGDAVRYGCGLHRYKGACANATTIRRDRLEEQLLGWLTHDLFHSHVVEQAAKSFYAAVQQRVSELKAEERRNAVNAPELRKELAKKEQEARNAADFILSVGRRASPSMQVNETGASDRPRFRGADSAELIRRRLVRLGCSWGGRNGERVATSRTQDLRAFGTDARVLEFVFGLAPLATNVHGMCPSESITSPSAWSGPARGLMGPADPHLVEMTKRSANPATTA